MVLHERSRWVYEHLPTKVARVLDVGCYDGTGVAAYVSGASLGVGIDLDLPALVRGATRNHRVRLLAASADALPFQAESFDCVIFSEVLEHVPEAVEDECIRELRRVMTTDGTLLFTTPHRGTFWWLDPLMAKTNLRRITASLQAGKPTPKGHKHYRVDEIQRLLGPHFEVLVLERRGRLLHPLAYWGHIISAWLGSFPPLMRVWQRVIDADYARDYADAAYNLCVVARAR